MAMQVDVDQYGSEFPLAMGGDATAAEIIEIINEGITKLVAVNGEAVPGYFLSKVNRLASTKADIAAAIEGDGIDVPDGAPFSAYAALIASIPDFIEEPIVDDLDEINGEVIT
jgi:hypothetical protein